MLGENQQYAQQVPDMTSHCCWRLSDADQPRLLLACLLADSPAACILVCVCVFVCLFVCMYEQVLLSGRSARVGPSTLQDWMHPQQQQQATQ